MEQISEIDFEQLSSSQQKLWQKAKKTFELGQYPYALGILSQLLEQVPGFLEARKLSRNCAAKITDLSSPSMINPFTKIKIESQAKKNFAKALSLLEQELQKYPFHPEWNFLLFKLTLSQGLEKTAIYSLELVRKHHPEKTKILHHLAEYYANKDNYEESSRIYAEIAEKDPSDIKAARLAKDFSARSSMQQQKWGSADGIRSLLKDKEETENLEKDSRQAMSKEQLQEELALLAQEYEKDDTNSQIVREIASLYESLEDWQQASTFFEYASQLLPEDFSLKEKATMVKTRWNRFQLEELEKQLENESLEEQKQFLLNQRENLYTTLISEYHLLVKNNPTEPIYRYQLAEMLYKTKSYDEAVTHLQKIISNPRTRLSSALLLGEIFEKKGVLDLAIKQFDKALEETKEMNSTKKKILYRKSLLQEQMGKSQEALEGFKKIYEIDHLYQDVAKRVEKAL